MRDTFVHQRSFEVRWKLLEAAQARLSAATSLSGIVEIVRSTARSIFSADGVTFVLRDGEQCHYVEEDAISSLWKGQRFPLTACISGWAMLSRRTAVIKDIYVDPRIPHDAYRRTFVKSLVMAPVGTPKPMAAIGAYWKEMRDPSDREIATVEALAAAVAQAMENAATA